MQEADCHNASNLVHTKDHVCAREYRMYQYLDSLDLDFIPKLYDYDHEKKILRTQKVNNMSVADFYGEDFDQIPAEVIRKIRDIVTCLYELGIVYPDITGYNFIEDEESHVWVCDFEHCFRTNGSYSDDVDEQEMSVRYVEFVRRFCFEGEERWNPDFL